MTEPSYKAVQEARKVDPDEELAREVAEYLEAPCDRALIKSALRRLRELGKLVKETPDAGAV